MATSPLAAAHLSTSEDGSPLVFAHTPNLAADDATSIAARGSDTPLGKEWNSPAIAEKFNAFVAKANLDGPNKKRLLVHTASDPGPEQITKKPCVERPLCTAPQRALPSTSSTKASDACKPSGSHRVDYCDSSMSVAGGDGDHGLSIDEEFDKLIGTMPLKEFVEAQSNLDEFAFGQKVSELAAATLAVEEDEKGKAGGR